MASKHDPSSYTLKILDKPAVSQARASWESQFDDVEDYLLPSRYLGHLDYLERVVDGDINNDEAYAYGLYGPAKSSPARAVVTIVKVRHRRTIKVISIRCEPLLDASEKPDLQELAAILAAIITQAFGLRLKRGVELKQFKLLCDGPFDVGFAEGLASAVAGKGLPIRVSAQGRWLVIEPKRRK